jgi:hypothetical protein
MSLARFIHQHCTIDSMHWVLDVTFTEGKSRIRTQTAPQTAAMLRRLAVSILSSDTSTKDKTRSKRYRASLSTDVLEKLLLSLAKNQDAIAMIQPAQVPMRFDRRTRETHLKSSRPLFSYRDVFSHDRLVV